MMARKPKKQQPALDPTGGKSWKRRRREAYMSFSDGDFREAVYSLAKSLQSQGVTIPRALQDYVDHVDGVRRDIPKPAGGNA